MPMPIRPPLRLAHAAADAHDQRIARRPHPGGSGVPIYPFRAVACLIALLLLLLASGLSGCGGSGRPCRFDDIGDQMLSTREIFAERMAGCPIGGRD
jgi:hypothetical protein